jgi:hypothetical protein
MVNITDRETFHSITDRETFHSHRSGTLGDLVFRFAAVQFCGWIVSRLMPNRMGRAMLPVPSKRSALGTMRLVTQFLL